MPALDSALQRNAELPLPGQTTLSEKSFRVGREDDEAPARLPHQRLHDREQERADRRVLIERLERPPDGFLGCHEAVALRPAGAAVYCALERGEQRSGRAPLEKGRSSFLALHLAQKIVGNPHTAR